jgi:ParB family transcriptional regulator, chromosome partitioning protein
MSKRDDINKAVLGVPASSPSSPTPLRALSVPFVARIAQAGAQGLLEENRQLKAERSSGRVVLELDPKRVRFSSIANRDERSLNVKDAAFLELKTDLAQSGQEFPIKVRAIEGDPAHEFEVVAGHRRLKACLELDRETEGGFPVLAILDANTAELKHIALKMYRENKVREDLSPYEYGRMFRKWLDAGVFKTQSEIAAATRLSQPSVSVYTAVYELPREIHAAFGDPRVISMRWIQELAKALKADEAGVLGLARELARLVPKPPAEAIYEQLTNPATSSGKARRGNPTRTESFKLDNKVVYTFGRKEGRFAVKLGRLVDKSLQKELAEDLQEFLRGWLTKRMKGRRS